MAWFAKLVLGNPTMVLDILFDILQRLPVMPTLPGIYEVLDYEASLELTDSKGKTAVYRKKQDVRFLQNNIIAYQDSAWGDGEIFADYKCSPGVVADKYREGDRYYVVISLRETKNRDDKALFDIERTIEDGFLQPREEFQVDIDHRTHHLTMRLEFPAKRLPTSVVVIERNSDHTYTLGEENRSKLSSGDYQYSWEVRKPTLFESYIMRWEW